MEEQDPSEIQAPKKPKRKWLKVVLMVLGSFALITASLFAGYKFAQIQQEREQTRSKLEQIEMTQCEQDGDCTLAIRLDDCCNCPQPVSHRAVQKDKNWVEYELWKAHPKEEKDECRGVACFLCADWNRAICENRRCKGTVCITYPKPEDVEKYNLKETPKEYCGAVCGDGICDFIEKCLPSRPMAQDCGGGLYCPRDCE